jgi:type I restriction-modification system DNA methylase subunit
LLLPDEILDNIKIDDAILHAHTIRLSNYDFDTEVDVNILGHIFEHSLNEIEEVQSALEGKEVDNTKTRRKKDGVFYTPKYITKYIVENTVGALCTEKKKELEINDDEVVITNRKNKKKELLEKIDTYRNWLLKLTICDPACGSGAFLNQALDFLISEHKKLDELIARITNSPIVFADITNSILENNIFGVDINEEAVEIARLSLWLKTAQKGRKLSNLSSNIKCGNSLIDDPTVAGDKAFNWFLEFPQVFPHYRKPKQIPIKEEPEPGDRDYLDEVDEPLYSYKQGSKGFEKYGFDVVIGNPPYVLCQPSNTADNKLNYYKTFKVASYKIDLFHLFYEKAITILKEKGKLGFITPNTYLTNKYIQSLRSYILDNTFIETLVNYNEVVFVDAGVDVATLILTKIDMINEAILIMNSKNGILELVAKKSQNDWKKDKEQTFNINIELSLNIDKTVTFGEIGNTYFGIQAYDRKSSISDVKITDAYLPLIDGADIFRYQYSIPNKYFNFLEANIKSGGDWNIYLLERIVIRQIGQAPIIGFCDSSTLTSNTIYNLYLTNDNYNLKYVLAILNSKFINAFWKSKFNDNKDLFPKIKGYQIKQLPIPKITIGEQKPLIAKAEIMLFHNKELKEIIQKFHRTVQRKFAIADLSNKLQDWYLLNYSDFIKELAKKKIKLSLAEEAEWEDYFNQESRKALGLKAKIDATDKEIDSMVYELYGLKEEEIKVVEGS